jgi:hypothetical protein
MRGFWARKKLQQNDEPMTSSLVTISKSVSWNRANDATAASMREEDNVGIHEVQRQSGCFSSVPPSNKLDLLIVVSRMKSHTHPRILCSCMSRILLCVILGTDLLSIARHRYTRRQCAMHALSRARSEGIRFVFNCRSNACCTCVKLRSWLCDVCSCFEAANQVIVDMTAA